MRRKTFKIVIYVMLGCLILTTLLSGISVLLSR